MRKKPNSYPLAGLSMTTCEQSEPPATLPPVKSARLSAELFTIPVEDGYLIYAPLRQAAFLTNAEVVNFIADLQAGHVNTSLPDYEALLEFLRRLEIVDAGYECKPITTFTGPPKPTLVSLFITTACNLRCSYCFASAGDTPVRVMPLDVAKRGIDFVIANAVELRRDQIEISYHGGGEPRLNWATLTGSYDYAVQEAAAHGLKVEASLATNGVMPDHKIGWVIQHISGVSLSFDGLPEVHDAHRVDAHGKGTAASVIQTIRRFDEAKFPYGLRLTVTRENIEKMEASVRFICQNFKPKRIVLEPAFLMGRWREAPATETEDFIAGFRAAQTAAQEFGREILFSGVRLDLLSNHFCGSTKDSFGLTADGSVSACYETFMPENEWSKVFFYGRYVPEEGTYEFNMPVLESLRRQSVEHRPFCHGCFAKWTCSGDCYHKLLCVNGDSEFRGSDRCHVTRELTKDQILDRIGKAGGLIWHEERKENNGKIQGKEMLI